MEDLCPSMRQSRRLVILSKPGRSISVRLAEGDDNAGGDIAKCFRLARKFTTSNGVPSAIQVGSGRRPCGICGLCFIRFEFERTDLRRTHKSSAHRERHGIDEHGRIFEVANELGR